MDLPVVLLPCFFSFAGIKKKLKSLGQVRDCDGLKPWVSSIVNHLFWSAVSLQGDGQLAAA